MADTHQALTSLPHPPHSPDLPPSDFCLFPLPKEHLSDTHFSSDNDVIASVEVSLQGQDKLSWYTKAAETMEQVH